ncbi:MAG: hypothetical protein JWP16_2163 [Alphaproteobacteria bacterium]|jgi:hypothetical protein|nr:hypothetical protein [Alphaproteobacteria bacterium]MDB5741123.1 hypothetical protein [Alphaproteobacteria bacterium]
MNRKMIFAAALLATMPAIAPAWAQDGIRAQLGSCLAIPGVLQRLACYDSVAKGNGITSAARPPAAASVYSSVPSAPATRQPPPVVAYAPAGLGSERLPQAQVAGTRTAQILAEVTKLTFDGRGRFTMTLDNGEVWRQVVGDQTLLREKHVSTVRISRGAIGSYDLTVSGRNAVYTVSRLQ